MKKSVWCLLLALIMLLTVASSGALAESAAVTTTAESSDVDEQLILIYSQRENMIQKDNQRTWYYTVTDLDHDGNLEFIAASLHPEDRSTNLKIWEVAADRKSFTECSLDKEPEESFPDIMTDSADTFHDTETDTWYYLCYDNIIMSDTDVYTIKTSVSMKDGVMKYVPYAVEHTVVNGGWRDVSYTDASGAPISSEQFNSAGTNSFVGKERTNTSFEWLTENDAATLTKLTDSYAVFSGVKKLADVFPVPKPAALQTPEVTPTPVPSAAPAPSPAPAPVPTPVPTPTPAPQPSFLLITKNPTNENKKVGGTALFVACANVFDSLNWTMVSPDGGEYSPQSFAYMFADAPVSGEYSTTLSIGNVATDMNGWGAYCTFYYNGQTARTSTAYIYVSGQPAPTPSPSPMVGGGVSYGSVVDWSYSTITVDFGDSQAVLPQSICTVSGDLYYGAPATAAWQLVSGGAKEYQWCSIEGDQPVGPVYGSMSGTAYDDSMGSVCIFLQNGDTVYISKSICNIYGNIYAAGSGSSCTVYYTDYPSESNIYSADIYGYDEPPQDDDGDQGGWAGSNYYENEYGYNPNDDWDGSWADDEGGWAGSQYEDPDNSETWNWDEYNDVGDEHNRVTCAVCGNHFSVGLTECPVCGWSG